jgi:hypothetical protein
MRRHAVLALALSAGISTPGILSEASAKDASFDGTWHVRLVTEAGTCDSSYSQVVAIENGRMRPVGGSSGTAISGGVGTDGSVALTISQSIATANARGRLRSKSGSGNWTVAMLGCTGRWTASRA